MESYSMLEQLPFTVVEVIAKYCSPKEMAVCCAVSSQMRDMFGENLLWRRHCTRGLAEYLRNTPCKVQPGFFSPESEDSTLSSISRARLDFMLENHLWNNWRLGKKVREEIEKESETCNRFSIWDRFHSNDYVMSYMDSPKRIELFDVRSSPLENMTIPVPIYDPYDDIHVLKNRVCLIKNQCVEVCNLEFKTKQNTVEHVFFFDKEVKEQSSSCSVSAMLAGDKSKSLLIGSLLIAVKEGDATLHIWNVETGLKVNKQECPLPCGVIEQIKEADSNLIIDVTNSMQTSNKTHTILVYNVNELIYQPFKLNLKKPFDYQVAGKFLAVVSNSLLTVFNYKTSEAFMNDIKIGTNALACFQNSFLFLENNQIKVCDPCCQQIIQLPIDKVHSFQILSDRFLQVARYHRYELGIWEFPSFVRPRKTRMHLDFQVCAYYLNKANTRYIVRYGSHGTLIHFW